MYPSAPIPRILTRGLSRMMKLNSSILKQPRGIIRSEITHNKAAKVIDPVNAGWADGNAKILTLRGEIRKDVRECLEKAKTGSVIARPSGLTE